MRWIRFKSETLPCGLCRRNGLLNLKEADRRNGLERCVLDGRLQHFFFHNLVNVHLRKTVITRASADALWANTTSAETSVALARMLLRIFIHYDTNMLETGKDVAYRALVLALPILALVDEATQLQATHATLFLPKTTRLRAQDCDAWTGRAAGLVCNGGRGAIVC